MSGETSKAQTVACDAGPNPSPDPTNFAQTKRLCLEVTQAMTSFEYNMNHKSRGIAIIFNHMAYNAAMNLRTREGTNKDVENLKKHLPLLGFEPENIIVENDLTETEIINYSHKIRALKDEIYFKDCDCIAIFVLSHGSKGNRIYARDGDYDLYRLVEQYIPNNFKELAAKPKLFFINACRGGKLDAGVKLIAHSITTGAAANGSNLMDNPMLDQFAYVHPVYADILISMSSHYEHVTFRDINLGSWFIQDLCYSIERFHARKELDTTDITELLLYTHNLVSQRISQNTEKQAYNDKKQIPNFNSALCRKLYFKSKE